MAGLFNHQRELKKERLRRRQEFIERIGAEFAEADRHGQMLLIKLFGKDSIVRADVSTFEQNWNATVAKTWFMLRVFGLDDAAKSFAAYSDFFGRLFIGNPRAADVGPTVRGLPIEKVERSSLGQKLFELRDLKEGVAKSLAAAHAKL